MPKPAVYVPVLMDDKEERDRIVQAGDSNFFDAVNGNLYIKKSALSKYGIKTYKYFFDELYSKKKVANVWFDFKPNEAFSNTEDHKKSCYDVYIKHIKPLGMDLLVRLIEDIDKPIPAKTIAIYLHGKERLVEGGGTFRIISYNYGRTKTPFARPVIKDVCLKPREGVYLLKNKIVTDCVSYNGHAGNLIDELLGEYARKITELKDLTEIDYKDILKQLIEEINKDIIYKKEEAIRRSKELIHNIDNYSTNLQLMIKEKYEKDNFISSIKLKDEDDVPIYNTTIENGAIVYHLKPFTHKGVEIKSLKIRLIAGRWHIEPENDKLKAPAPWLWWDEEKKSYFGYVAPQYINVVEKEFNVLGIINIIKMNSDLDNWPDYKMRYENFIKESKGENGEAPKDLVRAEGVAQDVPVRPLG